MWNPIREAKSARRAVIVAGAWDGIGTAIITAVAGALTVVAGASAAYLSNERSKRAQECREGLRALILEISDLNDAATRSRARFTGEYNLYPLRQRMSVSRNALDDTKRFEMVRRFYEAASDLRQWVRDTRPKEKGDRWEDDAFAAFKTYRTELRAYGQNVIDALSVGLVESRTPTVPPPNLPKLPRRSTDKSGRSAASESAPPASA
jgi:NAD(P)-dependent dehydrogenase (short-subunit alcohol dehydrogenase family)